MKNKLKDAQDFIPTEWTQWDSSWPRLADASERHSILSILEDRFGISERMFEGFLLFRRKKSWSLIRNVSHLGLASNLKISKPGLKAFKKVGAYIKPTTRMIQIFGGAATRARLDINKQQLQLLTSEKVIPMDLDITTGYVILTFGGNNVLGLGFYSQGQLRSEIPKKELRKNIISCGL